MADTLDITPNLALGDQILAVAGQSDADAEREKAARKDAAQRLASRLLSLFQQAVDHKQRTGIVGRLNDCKRRRDGEYDAQKLALIREVFGNELYANIIDCKCAANEAWLLYALGDKVIKPCGLEPTPVPDLSDAARAQIDLRLAELMMSEPLQGPVDPEALREKAYDNFAKDAEEEARQRAERMEKLIDDQREEGGYAKALIDFLNYFSTYPWATMKGPYVSVMPRHRWSGGALEETVEPVKCYKALSPFDEFPAPNSDSPQTGPFCEMDRITARQLSECKGLPGWSDEAIDEVLSGKLPTDIKAYLPEEIERAQREGREPLTNGGLPSGSAACVWVWEEIRGIELIDAGFGAADGFDDYSPDKWYDACSLLVGPHVVYSMPNPNPLGIRPYFKSQFRKVPGSYAGRALPEIGASSQDAANASIRSALDRMAFSARPQVSVDRTAVDASCRPAEPMGGKVWTYDGTKMANRAGSGKPVEVWFQDPHIADYVSAFERFKQKLQDDVGIPDYIQGATDIPGAGQTASGMSMLMGAAAKGIQMEMGYIDVDILRPQMTLDFLWNLQYLPDDQYGAAKGDCRVAPRGLLEALYSQTEIQRITDLLAISNNPTDLQLLGTGVRLEMWRARLRRERVPGLADKLPSESEALASMAQQQMMTPPAEPGVGASAPQPPASTQMQNAVLGGSYASA